MGLFDAIIPLLAQRARRSGSAVLLGSHERILLKRDAFREVVPKGGGRILFVDSGSGEILAGPNVSVCFFRMYAGLFEGVKCVKREVEEFFVVVCAFQKGLDLGYEVTIVNREGKEEERLFFDAQDHTICFGGRRAEPGAVVGVVRKLLELRKMIVWCAKLKSGDVIVRDGDLDAFGELLEGARTKLKVAAQGAGVVVLGVAKTSALCTDAGGSALEAVRELAPKGAWYYYVGSGVSFVRLHARSDYVFRCDVFAHDRDVLPRCFELLANQSSDAAFLGYPFGLIDADRFAQVPKSETAQLRLRFAVESKDVFRSIERALDAHDILNALG